MKINLKESWRKRRISSSTLHNVDELADFSVYVECDKFCLIIACERKRHSTRHKRDRLSRLNTLQRIWRPFYLQRRLTSKNSIYSCPSCLVRYFNVCPVHSLFIARVCREQRLPAFGRNYFQNFATLRSRRMAVAKNWYEKRDTSRKGISFSARYREHRGSFLSSEKRGGKKAGGRFSRTRRIRVCIPNMAF